MSCWMPAALIAAALVLAPSFARAQQPPRVGGDNGKAMPIPRKELPKPVAPGVPVNRVVKPELTLEYVMLVQGKPVGKITSTVTHEQLGRKALLHISSTTNSAMSTGTSEVAFY